jgi:hypothetical protein
VTRHFGGEKMIKATDEMIKYFEERLSRNLEEKERKLIEWIIAAHYMSNRINKEKSELELHVVEKMS